MTRVEETLASYLAPDSASCLKVPKLPTKPCRTTLPPGQAYACLHILCILQAYQAHLLRDLDEVESVRPDTIEELHWATDLSLQATKKTTRSMAALVTMERHLWLDLFGIKDRDKTILMVTFLMVPSREKWSTLALSVLASLWCPKEISPVLCSTGILTPSCSLPTICFRHWAYYS